MKTYPFILLSVLLIAVSKYGWAQNDTAKADENTIQRTHVIVQKKVASRFFGNQHSLRINNIVDDSRCPEDVDCVWGGSAKIEFDLIISDTNKHTFTLEYFTDGSTDTIINHLKIQLQDLTPDLRSNRTINDKDYRVVALVSEIDTLEEKYKTELLETKLRELPQFFFSSAGVSRFNIATSRDNFQAGCVRDGRKKDVLLNSIKLVRKDRIQVVSLSFGGKRLVTKLYYLDLVNKQILQVKEVYH